MADDVIERRTYVRTGVEEEQTVFVTVDSRGYVRLTANNLDELLTHLAYRRTDIKENA